MSDETVLGLRRPKSAAIRLIWLPVAIAGVVWLILRAAEWSAPVWQLWLLAVVFVTATTLTVPLSSPYLEQDDLLPVHARAYSARSFGSVSRWESRLSGDRDVDEFRRVVQDRMVLLIAERLRLRHGVELAADGPRAQHLLGHDLYRFCTQPVPAPLNHRQLDGLITRIEQI